MSRSVNTEIYNPTTKTFEWQGSKGGFKYYDKETKTNIEVPYPFKFIVLDTLSTISGFDDASQSGYWSNEIRNIKEDILTVRNKQGVCATGVYESVITSRDTKGSKFCQNVYIVYFDGKQMKIGNIKLVGAALSAWFDFRKTNKVFEIAISVSAHTEAKKGATTYQVPIFKAIPISKESDEAAKKLDTELQEYLNAYFKVQKTKTSETTTEQAVQADLPSVKSETDSFMMEDAHGNMPLSNASDNLPF